MKVGQLVKRRFFTGAERRMAQHRGIEPDEVGLIVFLPWQGEVSDNAWVMWPSKSKQQLMKATRLEVVSESR